MDISKYTARANLRQHIKSTG